MTDVEMQLVFIYITLPQQPEKQLGLYERMARSFNSSQICNDDIHF